MTNDNKLYRALRVGVGVGVRGGGGGGVSAPLLPENNA